MYLPRLRKINQALEEIKQYDKDTELNWKVIKQLIKAGYITPIKFANAWLINIDELYSIFYKKDNNNENNNDTTTL